MKQRRQWNMLREKTCQGTILYSAKTILQEWGQKPVFSNKQTLRKLTTN